MMHPAVMDASVITARPDITAADVNTQLVACIYLHLHLQVTFTAAGRRCNICLSMERLPVQALVSPLSGLLGDNFNRIHLVAAGTLLWGFMAAAIGMATTLSQASPCSWQYVS